MPKLGFLFDVDGCITAKESKELHIPVDPQLLPWFRRIKQLSYPIAFITGRAYPFMRQTALPLFQEKYLLFFEYGWCKYINEMHVINEEGAIWRKKYIQLLFHELDIQCRAANIPFSLQEHVLAPGNGALWIEVKYAMISLVINTKIPLATIYSLIDDIIPHVFASKADYRLNKHHLGIDLLPLQTSKRNAALEARHILDPQDRVTKWYVFGDSTYDREMCEAFETDKVEFVLTKDNASLDVLQKLSQILV